MRQIRAAKKAGKLHRTAMKSSKPPTTVSLRNAVVAVPRKLSTYAWRMLLDHVADVDHTGARIVNVAMRADVHSMKVAQQMLVR